MNSEELEVSLRTEFESYLKNVFADMRQEISQIQEKIEAEIENHKTQLEGVFKEALSRVEEERSLDTGFSESVVEHLRLAKDEGARITATAIAEAEDLAKQNAPKFGIKEVYEGVSDISTKLTQAEILKTLVHHAGQFTPRGAFYIIKNEHFVGWRTFGGEKGESDEAVREVFMPFSSDSLLSESIRSLVTVESSYGTYADDAGILSKLGFEGSPEKMYAIPLVVRGRAVAVLYADYGTKGSEVSVEALETLVRVAGLTVELLASAKGAPSRETKKKPSRAFVNEGLAPVESEPKETAQPEYAAVPNYSAPVSEPSYKSSYESESFSQAPYQEERREEEQYKSFDNYQPEPAQQEEETPSYSSYQQEEPAAQQETSASYEDHSWSEVPAEAITEVSADDYAAEVDADEYSTESYAKDYAQDFSTETKTDEYSQGFSYQPADDSNAQTTGSDFSASPTNDYQYEAPVSNNFESSSQPQNESFQSFSSPQAETYEQPAAEERFGAFAPEQTQTETSKTETSFSQPAETESQPVQQTPPVRSRFSERNVDLPIEVSEDERRLHNDARRFARLLVSEIKLYNEQKVKEGRESGDLYDRLREAIDRSREMYDKRVQSPVASKFDYFHYELVNTLAEGDATRLGSDYPGATV